MEKRILIVDDCEVNVDILQKLLRNDYEVETARSGEQCLEKLPVFSPDVVLLDIMMPGLDGYDTCRRIKQSPLGAFTQVVLVSGKASTQERLKGYEAGADDYIVKPFDHDELLSRVRLQYRLRDAMEELWKANARIQEFNSQLEHLVEQRTAEVIATRDVAVFALASLAESRDPDTGEHLERIQTYARILAEQLGREGPYTDQIDEQFIENVYRSSPLHDIGKVGISDSILLKPARLTNDEFEAMREHSAIGATAMEKAAQQNTSGGFLEMAIEIARHHHERFDGSGYPDGLAGREIPLAARIVALADVYDALTSARVYKAAYEPNRAKAIIQEESGGHFDPVVVESFLARYDDFRAVSVFGNLSESEALALSEPRR